MSRLREALAYEDGELVDVPGDTQAIIVAAARRFLALTETGPDYEAAVDAWTRFEGDDPSEWSNSQRKRLREAVEVIVDAALADHLTGETE